MVRTQNELLTRIAAIVLFAVLARNLAAAEIQLWPLLKIEKPNVAESSGVNVDFLWPIFELDTTKPKLAYAVRPFISYDGNRQTGTFLFPIGWFGKNHFDLAPLIWLNWGDNPYGLFIPIYGRWKGRETGFFIGPGFYLSSRGPEGEKKGSLLPPFFHMQSKDGQDRRSWILNYYQRRGDKRNDTALFPFFWWRSAETGDQQWSKREVYPFFGVSRKRGAQGDEERGLWVLWPLSDVREHEEGFARNFLGYAIQHGRNRDETWRAFLPFYYSKRSDERQTFSLPFLGYWSHTNHATGERRWLAWPFAAHRDNSETEAWSFASWLIRFQVSKTTADRKVAPLWPVAQWESSSTATRHRFWPLYRFSSQTEPETKKEFFALGEMIGYQEADRLEGGFWFLLRPITFQESNSGERRFRFFWKFVEYRTAKEGLTWAINPLFYSRTDEASKRWDLLGGLFGVNREADQSHVRALWFLKFHLPK